jgi:hypothetical protein
MGPLAEAAVTPQTFFVCRLRAAEHWDLDVVFARRAPAGRPRMVGLLPSVPTSPAAAAPWAGENEPGSIWEYPPRTTILSRRCVLWEIV